MHRKGGAVLQVDSHAGPALMDTCLKLPYPRLQMPWHPRAPCTGLMHRFLIQLLPAAVIAPLYFKGDIEFGVINQSTSGAWTAMDFGGSLAGMFGLNPSSHRRRPPALQFGHSLLSLASHPGGPPPTPPPHFPAFNHILGDVSLVVYQFESLAGFSAIIDRLGQFREILDDDGQAAAAPLRGKEAAVLDGGGDGVGPADPTSGAPAISVVETGLGALGETEALRYLWLASAPAALRMIDGSAC